jgi:peptidoglycan hydrolase-like protein with peptidoglycan-binding domain
VGTTIAYPAVLLDRPAVTHYQRILMGLGFSVGPRNADGWGGQGTATAVERFQAWYNRQPPAGRGSNLRVDGLLGPDTQRALQRYAHTASNAPVAQAPLAAVTAPAPVAAARPPISVVPDVPGIPHTTVNPTWRDPATRSYMDPADLRGVLADGAATARAIVPAGNTEPTAFPWVAVTATAASIAALVAVARYYHDRKAARR